MHPLIEHATSAHADAKGEGSSRPDDQERPLAAELHGENRSLAAEKLQIRALSIGIGPIKSAELLSEHSKRPMGLMGWIP